MWISKEEYEKLKQERNDTICENEIYRSLYDGLKRSFEILQSEYNELKETTLQLFEVEIYLHALKPITYNILASSPEEAGKHAIYMFNNKNKDFSAFDIVTITVKPMNCAR